MNDCGVLALPGKLAVRHGGLPACVPVADSKKTQGLSFERCPFCEAEAASNSESAAVAWAT